MCYLHHVYLSEVCPSDDLLFMYIGYHKFLALPNLLYPCAEREGVEGEWQEDVETTPKDDLPAIVNGDMSVVDSVSTIIGVLEVYAEEGGTILDPGEPVILVRHAIPRHQVASHQAGLRTLTKHHTRRQPCGTQTALSDSSEGCHSSFPISHNKIHLPILSVPSRFRYQFSLSPAISLSVVRFGTPIESLIPDAVVVGLSFTDSRRIALR